MRYFNAELSCDLPGVFFPVGPGRAVDLDFFYLARQEKRFRVLARHAAGADHTDHRRVFSRPILDASGGIGPPPPVLGIAVIDQRQRLAVLNINEQDQTAELSRTDAVFLLSPGVLVLALVDDVGLHPDMEPPSIVPH